MDSAEKELPILRELNEKDENGTGERLLSVRDLSGIIDVPFLALHHWTPCPLAEGIDGETLLWYLRHPFFLREGLLVHIFHCDSLRLKCSAFEREALVDLPRDAEATYREACEQLTGNRRSLFE